MGFENLHMAPRDFVLPFDNPYLFGVAQVSNLLYRRFPIGRTSAGSRPHERS
jgi:hypothetical protein